MREGHGKVVGVLPESLVQQEVLGSVPKDTRIVSDMHERKAVMASESGAFMALPGGCGPIADIGWVHRERIVGAV